MKGKRKKERGGSREEKDKERWIKGGRKEEGISGEDVGTHERGIETNKMETLL